MKKFLLGVAAISVSFFLLTGCASVGDGNRQPIPAKIADKVVEVNEEYRALRVCLMAAGVVEIMTDRIQGFDGGLAPEALGRLISLQGAIDTAKLASPLWMNTDMADVAIQLGIVLRNAGREKLSRILFNGPTIGNFLDIAERATLLAVKGDAVLLDINGMLTKVSNGSLDVLLAWQACEARMYKNKTVLSILSGV